MRLIDADALKYKSYETGRWMPVRVVNVEDIDAAPAIDAEPVRHGRWILGEANMHGNRPPKCSVCGKYRLYQWADHAKCNYCPNCGTKMDLEVRDDG